MACRAPRKKRPASTRAYRGTRAEDTAVRRKSRAAPEMTQRRPNLQKKGRRGDDEQKRRKGRKEGKRNAAKKREERMW